MIYGFAILGWLLLVYVIYRHGMLTLRYARLFAVACEQNELLKESRHSLEEAQLELERCATLIRMMVDRRAPITDDPVKSRLGGVQSVAGSTRTDH